MSSIQFNYFADEEGEKLIKEFILVNSGELYARTYFGEEEYFFHKEEEFNIKFKQLYVTAFLYKNELSERGELNAIDYRENKIIEYTPSFIRDDNVYVAGRLAYFVGNKFPEFKKEVQSLFRKLKKHCWKDKQWQSWVFETIGDEATVFIPNKVVHLKKEVKIR